MKNQIYQASQVLNTQIVDNPHYRDYIPYFQTLNKPKAIFLLTGMMIEFPALFTIGELFKDDFSNVSSIFQLDQNKPYFSKDQRYFLTLFNSDQNLLFKTLIHYSVYLDKLNIYPTVGIYTCHPLTSIESFIASTTQQFFTAKQKDCLFSYKNSYEFLTTLRF